MRVRFSFSSRRTRTIANTNKHHQSVPHIVKEVVRISDVILEILDARYIEKTRSREIENIVLESGKILIFVINKADLVDLKSEEFKNQIENLKPYVLFSCKTLIGRKRLRDRLKIEVKKQKMTRQAHIGIIGYPNTGKSSLINLLTGRKASGTSSESGFTKGMQKIRFTKDILILDTPGVFPDKEDAPTEFSIKNKHAEIGAGAFNRVKEPDFIVASLMKTHPGLFEKFYNIQADGDSEVLLEQLGRKKNFLLKGNQVNIDKTSRMILKEWQEGKIKQ